MVDGFGAFASARISLSVAFRFAGLAVVVGAVVVGAVVVGGAELLPDEPHPARPTASDAAPATTGTSLTADSGFSVLRNG